MKFEETLEGQCEFAEGRMTAELPSAAHRLNSCEWDSSSVSFGVFVEVLLTLHGFCVRMLKCVWASQCTGCVWGRARHEVWGTDSQDMAKGVSCPKNSKWKFSVLCPCLLIPTVLKMFTIWCTPPSLTESLHYGTVAEGAQSGGSTTHTFTCGCFVDSIRTQDCITAFAVLWHKKFIPETVAYITCCARRYDFDSCQYLCFRQLRLVVSAHRRLCSQEAIEKGLEDSKDDRVLLHVICTFLKGSKWAQEVSSAFTGDKYEQFCLRGGMPSPNLKHKLQSASNENPQGHMDSYGSKHSRGQKHSQARSSRLTTQTHGSGTALPRLWTGELLCTASWSKVHETRHWWVTDTYLGITSVQLTNIVHAGMIIEIGYEWHLVTARMCSFTNLCVFSYKLLTDAWSKTHMRIGKTFHLLQ